MLAASIMLLPFCLLALKSIEAFSSFSTRQTPSVLWQSSLAMAPRYDPGTQKWSPVTEDDLPQAGYDLVGTLLRAGPKPFLMRVVSAEAYEQSVLKYMSKEKCSRVEAQGNMDAYFDNPNDWLMQKSYEKSGRSSKFDYAYANVKDPKSIFLTSIWSVIVVVYAANFWYFVQNDGGSIFDLLSS